jgi:phenylalanyl-tRNA synthetase beta chain
VRFSVRWLKKYLQAEFTVEELVDHLTNCGLEVEEVIDLGMVSGKLIVGEILKIEPIDGAEKIRMTQVMADEKEPLRIVCGAHNIKEGDRVPVAKFGMTFPDGMVLKPRKIMGIEGQGMLCSQKELGVAEDAAGIWILPEDTPVAEPYDAIIDISITPNRPDALSIIGIARDLAAKIAARTGKRPGLAVPDLKVPEVAEKVDSVARISVPAKEDCPRYTARVIADVKIGPSPRWMQVALESAGLRPINNLVDITNFVMLEFGHPLHAFDLEKIGDHHVVVRNAKAGEKITTLDGQEYSLEESDLLICDSKNPVALAGIMGGANSEITDSTKHVLLECAYFKPSTIRKTAKRLGKSTDSSYRFERGMDAKKLTAALNRAAQLMAEYADGKVLRGVIDVVGQVPEREAIKLRLARLSKSLGIELSGRQVMDVLTPLGFEITRSDREEMLVVPPSHRVDVTMEADLVEEVARIIGFDKIPETRVTMVSAYHPLSPIGRARRTLAQAAVTQGFCEALNFSFISEKENTVVGFGDAHQVHVQNPITAEQAVMRRSVLPSLLQNVLHNFNHGVEDVALFELGATYEFEEAEPEARGYKELKSPARETPYFAAVLAGGGKPDWRQPDAQHDFFQMKGYAEYFLQVLGHQKIVVEAAQDIKWLHPGKAARFLVKGEPLAVFGEVHPGILKELDIKKPVQYLEIALVGAVLEGGETPKYKELPRFPAVTRDIALVVDSNVASLDLERTIRKAAKNLLAGVRLFDVYEGKHVEEGKKSLAFSLTYRAADRTLKEEEVTEAHNAVLDALKKDGATLRT